MLNVVMNVSKINNKDPEQRQFISLYCSVLTLLAQYLSQQTNICSKSTIKTLEKKRETCSKFTTKTPEQLQCRSGALAVNFEHITYLFLVFLVLTLGK